MPRESVTAYPLTWPAGRERTEHPERASFGRQVQQYRRDGSPSWKSKEKLTVYQAQQHLLDELDRLGAVDVIVSSEMRLNRDGSMRSGQREPDDHGVSVWFDLQGEDRVLACDRWDRVADNVRAIAKHIEAMRGIERWGVGTLAQAFRGFAALPEQASTGRAWYLVLGFDPDPENVASLTRDDVESAYKRAARKAHPDLGGDRKAWDELQLAAEQGRTATEGRS